MLSSDIEFHRAEFLGSSSSSGTTNTPAVPEDSQGLSEAQLRQLYEEEEVERFMYLFSAYVTEVRLPGVSASTDNTQSTEPAEAERHDTLTGNGHSRTPPPLPRRPTDRALSEYIAYVSNLEFNLNYILPYLPPAGNASPPFTLNRLRLTSQRLYLATFFWFLWFHDLLLPALMFRILWCLLRRRLLPYPTLQELQERRQDTARARRFGEEVQERLSATTLGPTEMWRLFKLYRTVTKDRSKVSAKESVNSVATSLGTAAANDQATILDQGDGQEVEDLKSDLLHLLNELADLHERIKNIFTWRRPAVSRRYALLLTIVSLSVLLLPAQYVAKLVYLFAGMVFWHVVPVIAALPLIFKDAPTNADYAMDLITRRIAAGQDVGVSPPRKNHPPCGPSASASTVSLAGTSFDTSRESLENDGINWKKWGGRVAHGKALVEEGKQLLSSRVRSMQHTPTSKLAHLDCRAPEVKVPQGRRQHHVVQGLSRHTVLFPAQYASAPGLITLTPTTLYFTSLTATRAKLAIPCGRMYGVKKVGLAKGISITWVPTDPLDGTEREERFHWVGKRDELFARLLGPDGGRWTRV
ncbi:hypothetical protein BU15DRAFT_48725 [Melanogaster broomeanus]|nr:hypothetical protein BU15DRAFT_48725 [Melanogaster broomeanus]